MVIHAPHENVCHHITSYKIKNFVWKRTFFYKSERFSESGLKLVDAKVVDAA